jgi:hypothetical protein
MSTWALGIVMPFERLYKQKPNLAGVPEWGQRVWVHTDSGSKLDAQAIEGHWVGYDGDSTHAHRIYLPDKNRVAVEHNVRFTLTNIVTIYTQPSNSTRAITAASQPPPQPPTLPPTLPPAPPPAPTMPWPMPASVPLPNEDGEEGGEEDEGGGSEDEDCIDPAPPGQFQTPTTSKSAKPQAKANPSYAQPTCTSNRKTKPSDYKKRLEAGEGTVDGGEEEWPGKKKKKIRAFAAIADTFTDFGADYAFTAGLVPAAVAAIGDAQDNPHTIKEA